MAQQLIDLEHPEWECIPYIFSFDCKVGEVMELIGKRDNVTVKVLRIVHQGDNEFVFVERLKFMPISELLNARNP